MPNVMDSDGNEVSLHDYDVVMSSPVGWRLVGSLSGPEMVRFVRMAVIDESLDTARARRVFPVLRYASPERVRQALEVARGCFYLNDDGEFGRKERPRIEDERDFDRSDCSCWVLYKATQLGLMEWRYRHEPDCDASKLHMNPELRTIFEGEPGTDARLSPRAALERGAYFGPEDEPGE